MEFKLVPIKCLLSDKMNVILIFITLKFSVLFDSDYAFIFLLCFAAIVYRKKMMFSSNFCDDETIAEVKPLDAHMMLQWNLSFSPYF